MVYFSVDGFSAEQTMAYLASHGIDVLTVDAQRCRLVTHLHVTEDAVERVLAAINDLP